MPSPSCAGQGRSRKTLLCTKHGNRDSIAKALEPEQGYGTYNVTAFRMKVRDREAPALHMLWAQERGARKIVVSIPPDAACANPGRRSYRLRRLNCAGANERYPAKHRRIVSVLPQPSVRAYGQRKFIKITSSRMQNRSGLGRRDRIFSGEVEPVQLSDPERAC